jgi:cytochrome b561
MSSFARASYPSISKLFHWLTALLVVALYVLVWSVDDNDKAMEKALVGLHKSVGVTVAVIVVARLIWRRMAGVPALPPDLPAWQKIGSRVAHYAIYAMLILQPTIGFISSGLFGSPVSFFGLFTIPVPVEVDKELGKQVFGFHELIGNLLMYTVLLHSAAALYHHFIRKDDVLRSMLPGRSA